MIGTFVPGSSPVHRLPAGAKLAVLVLAGVGAVILRQWWQPLIALVAVLVGYPVAGLGWREAGRALRPLLWLLVAVFGLQLVVDGWAPAVRLVATILAAVLLAGLVTLTTRTTALVDVVVTVARPLRRVGVDPDRLGLLLALGIRSVPVVIGLAADVRDAQRARGLTHDVRAFAVPLVVRSIRHADTLGEALVARGVDDE